MDALQRFQQRLEEHFTALAAAKKPGGHPVFGLEHCLTPEEVQGLPQLLGQELDHGGCMDRNHWLCWIVHAVEHGYRFDGLVYWPTFSERTPDWDYYGDRDALRAWFLRFARDFGSVRPVGRWGEHYTYIAWPITNALLPYDLQVQLARAIYIGRYRLKEIAFLPAESVGAFIARHAENPSKRFELFLEQRELVGRVVKALLEGEPDETIIHRNTLSRIVSDLNQRHAAREWLKEAKRHYARFTAQLVGVKTSTRPDPQAAELTRTQDELDAQGVTVAPAIELRRHTQSQWRAFLLVPPFQPLVNARPEFREHLTKTRYRIPDQGDRQYWGLSLLSGQPVPQLLARWPQERVPLLQFTQENTYFDAIVAAECQIAQAEPWLFKRRGDGSAIYIAGRTLQANESYIVVGRSASRIEEIGEPLDLNCAGVTARAIVLPEIVTKEQLQALTKAGLNVRGKLAVQPVGLYPRKWSEDGVAEWVSRETPCLAVSRDHDFDCLVVSIDGGPARASEWSTGATRQLVALENLGVGAHTVSICALQTTTDAFGTQRKPVSQAELKVFVRSPSTWTPGSRASAAMIVDSSPAVPSMDDFLTGALALRADGDPARTVCGILEIQIGETPRHLEVLSPHRLPLSESVWRAAQEVFLRKSDLDLLSARSASIVLQAEDLGEVRIRLPQDPAPVRWVYRGQQGKETLKLVNDGVEGQIRVWCSPFEHPLHCTVLEAQSLAVATDVSRSLGLYVAEFGRSRTAVVLASGGSVHDLRNLDANVDVRELRTCLDLAALADAADCWQQARPSNWLARIRRDKVVSELNRQLYRVICGGTWVQHEDAVRDEPCIATWERLEADVGTHGTMGIALSKAWRERRDGEFEPIACLERVGRSFRLLSRPEDAQRAWTAATEPAAVVNDPELRSVHVDLIRGARLLCLLRELKA